MHLERPDILTLLKLMAMASPFYSGSLNFFSGMFDNFHCIGHIDSLLKLFPSVSSFWCYCKNDIILI